jgi:hypothetical protein
VLTGSWGAELPNLVREPGCGALHGPLSGWQNDFMALLLSPCPHCEPPGAGLCLILSCLNQHRAGLPGHNWMVVPKALTYVKLPQLLLACVPMATSCLPYFIFAAAWSCLERGAGCCSITWAVLACVLASQVGEWQNK